MSWLAPCTVPREAFGLLWLDGEALVCVALLPLDPGLVWARPAGEGDWRPWEASDLIADGMVEGTPSDGDWITTVAGRVPYTPGRVEIYTL